MGRRGRMILQGSMSCQFVQEFISAYLDNRLTDAERNSVVSHMASCRECAALHGRMAQVRENLRSLPIALAPAKLTTDLQVLASKEIVRRRHMGSASALLGFWAGHARLVIDNLMRPLAAPVAGGLASALFMFGMLVPYLGLLRIPANDKPTALHTETSVENAGDFGSRASEDTLIEVQIDGQGRMVDYSVLQGQMNSDVGNLLLFTTYTAFEDRAISSRPATLFLQPASSRIVIRRSRIVVKG